MNVVAPSAERGAAPDPALPFEALFGALPSPVFVADAGGRNLYANQRLLAHAGMSAVQMAGRGLFDLVHPDDLADGLSRWVAAGRELRGWEVEHRLRSGDGSYRWFQSRADPVRDADGQLRYWVGVCTDIDDRKRAEDQLRHADLVLREMDEAFLLLDAEFRIRRINSEGLRIDGRAEDQVIGKHLLEVWPETKTNSTWSTYRAAAAERKPVQLVYRHMSDVHDVWLEVRAFPVGDDLAIFYRDVTQREATNAALRDTSRRLDAILNNTDMAVFLMDHRQHCAYANPAAEALTGYGFAEMQGRPLHDVVHHKRPDGSRYPLEECPIDRAFPERARMKGEELFVARDGSFYPVAFTASPVLDDDGQPIGTVIEARSIAEEKARDAALRESEARYRAVFEQAGVGVARVAIDGPFLEINDRYCAILGRTREEMIGNGWLGITHPDDRATDQANVQRLLQGEANSFTREKRYIARDGVTPIWVNLTVALQRNSEGRPDIFIVVAEDIGPRKAAELALAQALETQEALLYEVNHRVKNNLQMVTSLLAMQARRTRNQEVKRDLLDAEARIGVVASIHHSLYSGGTHADVEMCGFIRALANRTVTSLGDGRVTPDIRCDGEIVLPLAKALPLALAVSELLTNAVKYAFPDGRAGTIGVTVSEGVGELTVAVWDDGIGLPANFDPARSSGVGFRIVQALVRQLRARLTVSPGIGGAAFQIIVPQRQVN